jgi:hypothetical protein
MAPLTGATASGERLERTPPARSLPTTRRATQVEKRPDWQQPSPLHLMGIPKPVEGSGMEPRT